LEVEFSAITHPGAVRPNNEDFHGRWDPSTPSEVRSHGWLFAVADGVGGQDKGEVASRTAVRRVVEQFPRARPGEPHSVVLPRIIREANTHVHEVGLSTGPGGARMATTIVACALRYDRAAIAHVGDSRCYLIRRGVADLLTRDHTVVNEQVRLGIMSAEEAKQADNRHVLTRSLGSEMFVQVDFVEHQIVPNDVLVLCSDGLHGPVPPNDIARVVSQHSDLSLAAERLLGLANQRDGGDNVTMQLIRIRDVERIGMYRGRPYKLR
jgi:PPM family protein phosphatase